MTGFVVRRAKVGNTDRWQACRARDAELLAAGDDHVLRLTRPKQSYGIIVTDTAIEAANQTLVIAVAQVEELLRAEVSSAGATPERRRAFGSLEV